MLSTSEAELLEKIDSNQLKNHLLNISSFVRQAGSEGERKSREYIFEQLDSSGIEWKEYKSTALLSTPKGASLEIIGRNANYLINVKTWSFSDSVPQGVKGRPFLDLQNEFSKNPLDLLCLTDREKDLEGLIIVAPWRGPIPVFIAQARGAAGYVALWMDGKEAEIHEGIVSFIWGVPSPLENHLYLSIPFVVTSYEEGRKLVSSLESDREGLELEIKTDVFDRVEDLNTIEATCLGAEDEDWFVVVGSHLDSWHYGATDNATGNALVLALAQALHSAPIGLNLRFCWWSGHSEGRYAGSSLYARDRFEELSRYCLAVMNADVPGMSGSGDYRRISVGPDLFSLAKKTVIDLTGQVGRLTGPVRGWDQSFQNIGLSPYFVWASLLPEGSPNATGDGTMGWWWHTEKDLVEHVDMDILLQDSRLYLLALSRLYRGLEIFPDPYKLASFLISKIEKLPEQYSSHFLSVIRNLQFCKEVLGRNRLPLELRIRMTRLLNRMLYCWKGPHEQDWAIQSTYLPGIELALEVLNKSKGVDTRELVVAENFLIAQRNRLLSLIEDLFMILS